MAERVENVGIFTAYGFAREGGYVGTKQEFEAGLAASADYANNAQASATAAANSADEAAASAASIDPDTLAKIDDLENGTIVPAEALFAKSIDPVSEESGTIQENPFISQGTGTNNNVDSVDTSPVAKQLEKQGNTVVENQLVNTADFKSSGSGTGYSWVKNQDGTITITVTDTLESAVTFELTPNNIRYYASCIAGHTFFYTTNNSNIRVRFRNEYNGINYYNIGSFTQSSSVSGYVFFGIMLDAGLTAGTYVVDLKFVDLTLWFGSNSAIPQDLLDHPDHWSWYYNGTGAYNTGSLANSNGRYLVCTGRNVWDETSVRGYIDGTGSVLSGIYRTSNYINVIPNTYYYIYCGHTSDGGVAWYDKDKNFIKRVYSTINQYFLAPANAIYMRFFFAGTSYANDATVSLYYSPEQGGEGYGQYYPYIASNVYNTGTEALRSAGSVKDVKLPSGEIMRRVGVVDLGTLTWNYDSVNVFFYAKIGSGQTAYNYQGIVSKYVKNAKETPVDKTWQNNSYVGSRMNLIIKDTSYTSASDFTTAMSGVYLYYELATPTTEQGTPFPENIEIDDYGMMYWLDTDNNLVSIPQGGKVFYPADYVLYTDTLFNYTEGDPEKITLKGALASGDPDTLKGVITYFNGKIPDAPTEDATYVLKVTVADGTATYAWVEET